MTYLTRGGLAILCMILFSAMVPKGSGRRQNIEEASSGSMDRAGLASDNRDELVVPCPTEWCKKLLQVWISDIHKVEKMCSNCGLALKDGKAIKNLEFSTLEGTISGSTKINVYTGLFARRSIQETISLLSPELKHMLLDCLSKKNFHFSATGENHSMRSRYAEYLEESFSWNPVARRHLAGQPFQSIPPGLAPAPVRPSSFALAPVLPPALAPPPNPGFESPSYGPAPSSGPAPASSSFPEDDYPSDSFSPKSNEPSGDIAPVSPLENQNDSKKTVVIAVVLSVAGASLIAAFLFCCYCGCLKGKGDLENGQRDDRPLLSLSLNEFSGSSHKSFGLDNSANKDAFGALSSKMDPSQNGHASSIYGSGETPLSGAVLSSTAELSNSHSIARPPSSVFSSSIELSDASNNVPTPAPGPPPPPLMPPPFKKVASPPPAPPPPLPNLKPGSRPPPPPKGSLPPRPPQTNRPSPLGSCHSGNAVSGDADADSNAPKTKLKPFFWDKVSTNPDQSMVWHQIKSGSFQFNEEMIETLFGYNSADRNKSEGKKESSSSDPSPQFIQILDPKKSQNLAISLKALNVKIEEVCDALLEGNELPAELLQTLLRMPPTTDEELKLRLYSGDLSLLGPAERFLKALVDIPFAFKRMDALLFMSSLEEDSLSIKESFAILEVACQELRSSRLFLKLLEAVLKTGNRMNDGTFRGGAQAFKLDTLLKLSDVKGTDGKTTLLHFVVQEIIRSEGVRAVRMSRESGSISSVTTISSLNSEDITEDSPLETVDHYRNLGLKVVSGLGNELENVKKAAGLDADALTSTVANLGHRLVKTKEFMNTDMRSLEEVSGFHQSLKCFVEHAEADITSLLDEEKRMRSLVKNTTDYFHGNAGKDEGFRLFVIVRDLLGILDKVCKEVRASTKKVLKTPQIKDNPKMTPVSDPRQRLFPVIRDRRVDGSSSDEEGT